MEAEVQVNPLKRKVPDDWEDDMAISPVGSTVAYMSVDGISPTGSKEDNLAGTTFFYVAGHHLNVYCSILGFVSQYALK